MDSKPNASKRKKHALIDSDEEDGSRDKNVEDRASRRQSTRIHNRRQKKTFKLPSRDEIWKDIPSATPFKIKNITPKKTVNNFTKVYNDYNYDDYDEDSSDNRSASSETDSECEEEEAKHRIKNYHKRIKQQLSSSDDSENEGRNSAVGSAPTEKASSEVQGDEDKHTSPSVCESPSKDCKSLELANESFVSATNNSTDSDSSDVLSPSGKNRGLRKHSVLESDSEENAENPAESHMQRNSSHSSDSAEECADASSRSARLKQKHKMLFKNFQEAQEAMKNKKKKKFDSNA